MKTLIIIPAYNEQDNIINTIKDLEKNNVDADYIVIDDCSKDKTKKILLEYGANYISLPINLGIGGGMQAGYIYALENNYDIAIQFDGDGQHDAYYINNIIDPIKDGEADIVIGSRFITREGFQSSSLRRAGISFISKLLKLLCGIKIYDVTSGMRAVNRRFIEEFSNNYAQDYPEPEAILRCGLMNTKLLEVPVVMKAREGGVSSITPKRSIYYMIKVSLSLIIARLSFRKRKDVNN